VSLRNLLQKDNPYNSRYDGMKSVLSMKMRYRHNSNGCVALCYPVDFSSVTRAPTHPASPFTTQSPSHHIYNQSKVALNCLSVPNKLPKHHDRMTLVQRAGPKHIRTKHSFSRDVSLILAGCRLTLYLLDNTTMGQL
jgi:hypothetical protein